MREVYHSLILNFHQPPGNLEYLLEHEEWEAKQILWSLDRMPRALWDYEHEARVHLALSGTLLETLANPGFQERVYGISKCGDVLWYFQNRQIFDVLGTGFYHPVLPLIPEKDWDAHIERWQGIARHLFWRNDFSGYWPSEMGFSMEMIPHLKRAGYRFVLVDSNYVEPIDPMDWHEVRYRPHVASYGGEEIIVVVRDRELSDAQESGLDLGWFLEEVHQRTQHCDFAPLVVTATDGDNGGWFRNTNEHSNFWFSFYRPFMDRVRAGDCAVRPAFIHDYLDQFGASGRVKVQTGAWNTGWHHGKGFVQWTGSQRQKDGLAKIREVSAEWHALQDRLQDRTTQEAYESYAFALEQARWRILRAETSCNLYWGEDWVNRIDTDLTEAREWMEKLPLAGSKS